jgi:hypothetical protein
MRSREYRREFQKLKYFPRDYIDFRNPVDFVPEKFDSCCPVVCIGRDNLDNIASDPEIIPV